MNRCTFIFGYFTAPIVLVAVIALEAYHLANGHPLLSAEWKTSQERILGGIRNSSYRASTARTAEELVKSFNAVHISHMTQADVLNLPERNQGLYSSYIEGALVPLEWDVYAVDTIPGYEGRLAIGFNNGRFENAFLEYTLYEGK